MIPNPLRLAVAVALTIASAWFWPLLAPPARSSTAPPPSSFSAEEVRFFENEVRPILQARCWKCHGDGKVKGGLSLASRQAVLKGGDLGPAVAIDDPDESVLIQAINYRDGLEMPPNGKMPQREIDVLTKWAKAKAPWGAESPAKPAPATAHGERPAVAEEWAYRTAPRRPEPPQVRDASRVRNPIDAFLVAKLEAKGLAPNPEADRVALIRRAFYDLHGLPPSPEAVDEFVNDPAPDAYERLIDRLLASPHYGERWGRHWLDVVRYAETHGYERDSPKPFAWRYRDYVIDSFNKDKPYDVFIREQIAGDELDQAADETLIATGYYRLGIWDDEPADRPLAKYDVLDGIVSATGQAVLGMSINCARCHDHKRDPISQRDYYRFLAFFHDISDMNARNTRRLVSEADKPAYEAQLRAKESAENEMLQELEGLEQEFAKALSERGEALAVPDLEDLSYRFYRNTWTELPAFDDLKPETVGRIASNRISLAVASREESIGLVFEAKLRVTKGGDYQFHLESTNGSRLIVDGKTLINQPGRGKQNGVARVQLDAGSPTIRVEYFNATEKPRLIVDWSGPGFARKPLTADASAPKGRVSALAARIRREGAAVMGPPWAERYSALRSRFDASRKAPPPVPGIEVMCVEERGHSQTRVLIRGNPGAPGDPVEPGTPSALGDGPRGVPSHAGKRRALAEWLTSASNPMTARVVANRLWHYHFGRGIVPTPNDFGKLGEPATHPELLDWLACEVVQGGWALKRMHKLIMTSNAYRMSSHGQERGLAVDPGNALWWRLPMRRLEAEEVRDSILWATGVLNLKAGGPSVYPPIPRAVLAGQSRPGDGWPFSSPEESARRSVYVHVKRSLQLPILAQHDQADTDSSCPVRYVTTVPTQALGMLNGEFAQEQAARFADRLRREAPGSVDAQVRRAIRLTAGRQPSAEEVAADVRFLEDLKAKRKLSDADALKRYALLILNSNEFVYLD